MFALRNPLQCRSSSAADSPRHVIKAMKSNTFYSAEYNISTPLCSHCSWPVIFEIAIHILEENPAHAGHIATTIDLAMPSKNGCFRV